MPAAFRQIGSPTTNGTRTVKAQVIRARKRVETLLNRRAPAPTTILTSLRVVKEALRTAYQTLPLHRLVLLENRIEDLCSRLDGLYFGRPILAMEDDLRQIYRTLSRILSDLDEKPNLKKNEDEHIRKFLDQAAKRGWRVQEPQPTQHERDGFEESVQYIRKMSIPITGLLPSNQKFGLTKATALLLHEGKIPETVLLEWTQMAEGHNVHMVFGNYVVLSEVTFLGIKPSLVLLRGEDGNAYLDVNRFLMIATYLQCQDANINTDHLITIPCRVGTHYYCPVLAVKPTQRRYFQKWDILVA